MQLNLPPSIPLNKYQALGLVSAAFGNLCILTIGG